MGERGLGIRSGVNKLGWEEADFPIVCNPCLGENPYIRMLKVKFARSCRICDRPYTVFKWRPGQGQKCKMAEICQTCGKLKNICQSCLRDLQFNMSMTERDEFLEDNKIEIPTFEANRDYWAEQANRNITNLILPYQGSIPKVEEFLREPRIVPAIENLQKIAGNYLQIENQDTKNDIQQNEDQQCKQDQFKPEGILPPDDPKICSLYVTHMTLDIKVGDIKYYYKNIINPNLREIFGRYGQIKSVKIMPHGQTCFVNFETREAANTAINTLFNNLAIKDVELKVQWARQPNKHFAIGKILNQLKPEQNEQQQQLVNNIKPVPPKLPPPNSQKTQLKENDFLMDIFNQANTNYPSQDPYINGGVRLISPNI